MLTYRPGMLWSRKGLKVLAEVLGRQYRADQEVVVYEASPFPVCPPHIDRMPLSRLPRARVTLASTLAISPTREVHSDPEMLERLHLRPTE